MIRFVLKANDEVINISFHHQIVNIYAKYFNFCYDDEFIFISANYWAIILL